MGNIKYKKGDSDIRPWGKWEVLDTGEEFIVKRITVNPKSKLSLQLHHHRSEHWIIAQGTALVTIGKEIIKIEQNGRAFIPTQTKHRIENATDEPVIFIEVQAGKTLDEDDIVRLEDDYGRI
jgi:mannose-6-phosphate isomerase-like protein (cupin superfamily)